MAKAMTDWTTQIKSHIGLVGIHWKSREIQRVEIYWDCLNRPPPHAAETGLPPSPDSPSHKSQQDHARIRALPQVTAREHESLAGMCDRGVQMLITTVGAFTAFCLMTIAVGTDYWLYSRGVCRIKTMNDNETSRKNEEVMTHSGLWRTCCLEGSFRGLCKKIDHFPQDADYEQDAAEYLLRSFRGLCKKIDHFPQDADYEQDAAEYLLRAVRASSIFPIMSVGLLFMGGLCVAASEFYKSQHNVILSAGIFFLCLSNIIGIIVYISANSGDPGQSDSKKSYSYGWSFYFGALSFIMAEMVGVLAVHMFIEKHRRQRAKSRTELIKRPPPTASSAFAARIPSYRYRFRRRSSCRSSEPASSRDASPVAKGFAGPAAPPPPPSSSSAAAAAAGDISMYTLTRGEPGKVLDAAEREFLQGHDSDPPEFKDALQSNAANRRTTPV
ncbi:hypothetical protein AAFF_G00160370 [Aldrovandia affinis]|uniref:Voltage-dependent calcium channel gamma-3 subunit n=1 Tax=Aldrovandia affinis TaxID=143900 RepID=A0AAD7RNA6_9TELE|nr:hypothetical protein AAFF_G00160370 [Aldrovandia affinis]